MKNFKKIAVALVLALVVVFAAACGPVAENLKGVTEDTIWVGNTAGTTGALAAVGVPFNIGIQAAFKVYNDKGGFDGKSVKLQHYDDGGVGANAATLMEKLIHEDEVFAIVGNFGTDSIKANLGIIKEAQVPMVYAASGINELFNAKATGDDRNIMPVQPLSETEGRMLLLRAFAPAAQGGMAATKVGIITNTNETSQAMLRGIDAEIANLSAAQKSNIVKQNVTSSDYVQAVNTLNAEQCDVIIAAVIQDAFMPILTQMKNTNFDAKVLTSYNNASTALITDKAVITTNRPIYAQAWLDITSATYKYTKAGGLLNGYIALDARNTAGVSGFNEEYWAVAEAIYDYCIASGNTATAFANSYNAYALAGYIAGDLFCQGLTELKSQGKELTRANYVDVMESKAFKLAMADNISFADGLRVGVESFALTQFIVYQEVVLSTTVHGLTSIAEYRTLLNSK